MQNNFSGAKREPILKEDKLTRVEKLTLFWTKVIETIKIRKTKTSKIRNYYQN